ncbi:Hsp70 family protein [Spirillospora sp. CA-255316]
MPLLDWGGDRRLRRLEAAFAGTAPTGKRLEKAARDYGRLLVEALHEQPPLAHRLFRDYDARLPDEVHAPAFPQEHRDRLAGFASSRDLDVLTVTFELATRLGLPDTARQARDGTAALLGARGDADRLVARLDRWRRLDVLDRETLAGALRGHLKNSALGRDEQLWTAFFAGLPESSVPDLFEVHAFLGRGEQAVRLADTAARRRQALDCCLRSPRAGDVRAGIELARREGDEALTALEERAGELSFERGEYEEALSHFRAAGRPDRESECHERLGRLEEALAACPLDQPDRLARLAAASWPEIDALVERAEFTEAARRARAVVVRLEGVTEPIEEIGRRLQDSSARREAVVAIGRRHFAAQAERAASEEAVHRDAVHKEWSRFEESAGDLFAAAEQAERAADLYRAHGLYLRAGRPGDAERVLRDDPGRWRARADAREAGGDLVGAAELHAEAGEPEEAAALYLRAGRHAEAARCLIAWRGDDAIEDARLAECLRLSGATERLAELCLRAVKRKGRATAGFEELRRLRDDSLLPPHLEAEVLRTLETLGAQGRRPFEDGAAAWLARAREDVDARYARIWALDLGTTTCAVAIYDGEAGEPVLCRWKGRPFFAATLTVDEDGVERVGVSGEEVLAGWVKGFIGSAKRRIGGATKYRMRDRVYRTEEVAARLIAHARRLVEDFLAERVLERVGELARAELGEVRGEWLDWLAAGHDLRLQRPRAILTIPAFFRNNQKQATRNACRIAGVELERLIHEPTAACIAAARQRRLTGEVVVVDLGAGTLDISALCVEDDVYDVHQVSGDTRFGGKDFDAVIAEAVERRLARDGVHVPEKGRERLRFEIAVEYLKIGLSDQPYAAYPLPGFNGDPEFRLELGRDELAEILAGPLRTLREICEKLKASLRERPEHLVLVGGPMLAPQVAGVVEDVFGLRRKVLADPRTAVAVGAAFQAAVLSGALGKQVLMDVTPLALGLLVSPSPGEEEFSALIEANTPIPTERRGTYTTTRDDQDIVRIQIYNGDLRPASKIGEFQLGDIAPAPKGEPEIEVTFAIDSSCVLEVTARDRLTGNRASINVADTTLLSPDEIARMTERHRRQLEREARRRGQAELREELTALVEEARRGDAEPLLREFRRRLEGHRAARARLDPGTERVLAEIYSPAATELETDLLSARAPLLDLAAKAEEYLESVHGEAGHREAGDDPDPAEGEHLRARLADHLDRVRPGLARVAQWNGVLARIAAVEADPLLRFRGHHAAGDHARALDALAELDEPPADPDDVRRHLHCLAETGAAAEYRRTLTGNAALLGAAVLDPARPEEFLRRIGPALVRVPPGRGVLISDRLVLTARPGHDGPTVETATGAALRVGHVFEPDSPHLNAALLQLAEPVAAPPLRLGHAGLVRIGDPVHVLAGGSLAPGVVDAFESFPEQDLNLYRVGLPAPPEGAGGPLFNGLGEVIGVLTAPARPDRAAFAIAIDTLAPLLTSAGYGVTT